MYKQFLIVAIAVTVGLAHAAMGEDGRVGPVLRADSFKHYIDEFNTSYPECCVNAIPNGKAWEFLKENVPLLECPDKEIEKVYLFRWWTFRKHIKQTPDGFVVTEFLPRVDWSDKHNTINCPAGHHLYEGRWIRNPKYLDDYVRFYFRKGGDPGGRSKHYSNWLTDGVYSRFLVNADRVFVVDLLDDLIADYDAWGRDGAPGNPWQATRKLDNGLYWQVDSWEGQEVSIGGTGARPPINSYMYAGAMAISRIAELAGRKEQSEKYKAEAQRLRELVQQNLWDPEAKFFKTLRHAQAPTNQYRNVAAEPCDPGKLVSVRELFGYVPWQFNLPEDGKGFEEAWRQLTDPRGFLGAYGPTVTERRHPGFQINDRGCEWRGASWPFATSQTLTALANLLNNYRQSAIGRREYFDTLKAYTRSHAHTKADGASAPWLDESLNPDTGRWILNWYGGGTKYPETRGRYYNHSTYCDLVITGLIGLRPREDDTVEVNPLVPEGSWPYFCLDNVPYHGVTLTILWDASGQKYGKGEGLRVLADGKEIASSKTLAKVTGKIAANQPAVATNVAKSNEFSWGDVTLRPGMPKAEVLAQITRHPGQWYAVELDAPPYGELYKMDMWVLSYGKTVNGTHEGGSLSLVFAGEKLETIRKGGQ